MSERIKNGIVVLVCIAWAVNTGLSMSNPNYHSDPTINVAFTAVLGFVLVSDKEKKRK